MKLAKKKPNQTDLSNTLIYVNVFFHHTPRYFHYQRIKGSFAQTMFNEILA